MAKLVSPLYGSSASGVFGGLLAFRSKSGLSFVGGCPVARDVRSSEVLGQQSFYQKACMQWQALSLSEKHAFSVSSPVGMNGFQFFMSGAAVATASIGFSIPSISDWFPAFSVLNIGLLGNVLYLLPGFPSGEIILLPVPLDPIVRFQDVSFSVSAVSSEGCSFLPEFFTNFSVLVPPSALEWLACSSENFLAQFPVDSSGAGRVLWVRFSFSQPL